MPRVKRGTSHVKKRKKLLEKVKGYMWGRKKLIRLAKTAVLKAGVHSYVDRKKKKRTCRALWQIKISAFVRQHGLSYSRFIDLLKKNSIDLDRKVLAQLAVEQPDVLTKIITKIKNVE
ncbi:MAG: 50S ribosomal protein L20 [Patescibacteria group bacterium]